MRAFALRHGDATLVGALLATLLLETASATVDLRDAAWSALVVLPLLARRRAPLLVLALTAAASLALSDAGNDVTRTLQAWVALNLALYTVAAHLEGARAIAGAAFVGLLELAVHFPRLVAGEPADAAVAEVALLGGVWLLGRWVRQRRLRTERLEQRAAQLEAERDAKARAAVADERARIAREMHDAIAHGVSVMVLQAGAAEQVLTVAPERARESLVTIQETGREAILELRRMLGVLRESSDDPALAPQAGVDRLDTLLEQVRGAGLPVELTVEGRPRRLPPGVDRSAYRIVQEALTNTLKHARAQHADVTLRYGGRDLEVEVVDDGHGASDGLGDGFGLVGMRERAALYGGALEAGPRPGGGYALHARLPLERVPP